MSTRLAQQRGRSVRPDSRLRPLHPGQAVPRTIIPRVNPRSAGDFREFRDTMAKYVDDLGSNTDRAIQQIGRFIKPNGKFGTIEHIERHLRTGSGESILAAFSGVGSPDGVVNGTWGDLYIRLDDGLGIQVYEKHSAEGKDGWIGVPPPSVVYVRNEPLAQLIPLALTPVSFDDAGPLVFPIFSYDSVTKEFTALRDGVIEARLNVGTELLGGNNLGADFFIEINGVVVPGSRASTFMTQQLAEDTASAQAGGAITAGQVVRVLAQSDSNTNVQTIPDAMAFAIRLLGETGTLGSAGAVQAIYAEQH